MENSSNMNKEQLLELVNSLEKSCGETNNNTSSVEADNDPIKHSDSDSNLATKSSLNSDDNKIKSSLLLDVVNSLENSNTGNNNTTCVESENDKILCSHCGGIHDTETKFCPTTGKRIPKKLPKLRACSNEKCSEFGLYNQPERVNYCSQCGKKISLSYNGYEIVDLGLSVKWAKYNVATRNEGGYNEEWGDGWRLPTIEEFGELFKNEHNYQIFKAGILKIETSPKTEDCIMLDEGTYRTSSGLFYVKIDPTYAPHKKGLELIEVTNKLHVRKLHVRLVIDIEK